jgi:hypothetical protein
MLWPRGDVHGNQNMQNKAAWSCVSANPGNTNKLQKRRRAFPMDYKKHAVIPFAFYNSADAEAILPKFGMSFLFSDFRYWSSMC